MVRLAKGIEHAVRTQRGSRPVKVVLKEARAGLLVTDVDDRFASARHAALSACAQ
ncbi:hypothetical protein [Sphingomonas sp. NBWT7]|uniref:hypothetical protein n=1 Tax=Sphingomonas sp. NBWT7 TaxID=2596913 RepID=UPI0016269424|nr:hypothetical protein [Sphingomonas sp. NBWT7]